MLRVDQLVQRVADGVVVQGGGQRGVSTVPPAGQDAPLVDTGIGQFLIWCVCQACVQLRGRVQGGAVGVEGHALKARKYQGTPAPEQIFHTLIEGAAKEYCPLDVQVLQRC